MFNINRRFFVPIDKVTVDIRVKRFLPAECHIVFAGCVCFSDETDNWTGWHVWDHLQCKIVVVEFTVCLSRTNKFTNWSVIKIAQTCPEHRF